MLQLEESLTEDKSVRKHHEKALILVTEKTNVLNRYPQIICKR